MSIAGNTAGAAIAVTGNTGGGTLQGNSAGTSCKRFTNTPRIAGSGNAAGAAYANSCND